MINPITTITSGAIMLLYSFGLTKEAQMIDNGLDWKLKEGYRTYDIMSDSMKELRTKEMVDMISEQILSRPVFTGAPL